MSNIRITFLRDDRYQPVGCIAINIDPGSAVLFYGLSVKNPQDHFDRKMARHLAIGRMVEAPYVVNMRLNGGELDMHDITFHVMSDIVLHASRYPSRAVKAARLWIKSTTRKVVH